MNNGRIKISLLILMFAFSVFAQSNEPLLIVSKSFVGKKINGVSFREFVGDVVITQKDVRITCNKAIQNLSNNSAELIGDVVVTQDTLVLKTPHGFYFGKTKKAFSNSGVFLNDGRVTLIADSGYYFANSKLAGFFGNVKLVDSLHTLFADSLYYFRNKDSALAIRNIRLQDSSSVIFADSLIYSTVNKFTDARGKVKIKNPKDDITIFAERLLNYSDSSYTLLTGRPLLIKIDTTFNTRQDSVVGIDTLFLSADTMKSLSDSSSLLIAKDSVLILRDGFASVNEITFFYRDENKIVTFKPATEKPNPVIWQNNSQLTGDSIAIFVNNNTLKRINVYRNAIIISKNEGYDYRFDQLSGDTLKIFFDKGRLSETFVSGRVLSIYYLYDNGRPNGLIKSSAKAARVFFEKNKVVKVKLYGQPESEYHPEKLIEGNEQSFTLPDFYLYGNRPSVEDVIGSKKIFFKGN